MNKEREFIELFQEIEEYLKRIANSNVGFTQLVEFVKRKDSTVNKYSYDLKEMAKLRNIIVHGSKSYALPTDYSLTLINKIRNVIYDPPLVYPFFSDVMTRLNDSSLIGTIKMMKMNDYSQIPIMDKENKFIGMLTNNAIARWVGELEDEGGGRMFMNNTPVSEVLSFEEENNVTEFVSKDTKLVDILKKYDTINRYGKKLNAFLITENGSKENSILGIITNWDIPKIYNELEIK